MSRSSGQVTTQTVRGWLGDLTRLTCAEDADRIDALRALEQLKAAAASAQARLTVELAASQRSEQEAAGVPARDLGKGIAAQVALARRDSPFKGSRHLGLAQALEEMPHTSAAFARGDLSEWRVTLAVRETACLTREDRAAVDAALAARPGGLASLGDRTLVRECRRLAYRLDPHSFTRRSSRAVAERRVSLRPAPDTMSLLTGLLPVVQGVAVYAALTGHADSLRSQGDERSRGQIMADTLVERVTGQATAAAVPVEVALVMSDRALLDGHADPAEVVGFGPVPAPFARAWLADTEAAVWLRRLYTRPGDESLVAMDSTRRVFTGQLRRFIEIRDQACRTPWCDAPVRHIDHPRRYADGGATTATNGQGLCEACNHAKEAPGWHAGASGDGAVQTVTPTGHRHSSPVPRSPVARRPSARSRAPSRVEISFRDFVLTA